MGWTLRVLPARAGQHGPRWIRWRHPIEPELHAIWTNAVDAYMPPVAGDYGRAIHACEKPSKTSGPYSGAGVTSFRTTGAADTAYVSLLAPQVEKPETAHFILKLADKGTPALTRYKRVIVTILPE